MKDISRLCLMALLTLTVAACGGGGGGSSSGGGSGGGGGGGGTTTVTKNFTVSVPVDGITINRVSNGDPVTVDTAALTQSGQVSITQ